VPPPDRLNVLLLLADEHSSRVCGAYGPTLAETPAIDGLASEGCLFENAYCNAPMCVPSRLSFLSGRYSSKIGAWSNVSEPPPGVPSVASLLVDHDYETAAVGKLHFVGDDRYWGFRSRRYGDLYGWSHQPDPIASAPALRMFPAGPAEIPEELMQETVVTRVGIDELARLGAGDRPFFLCLSYNRPHFPLRPPARLWERYWPDRADLPVLHPDHPSELHPFMQHHRRFYGVESLAEEDVRRARAAYYACVELVDEHVGFVLEAVERLGLRESTVVLYMSDHGEMYGEHGMWRKSTFFEEAVKVPLIIRHPHAAERGRRVAEVVELVDLLPTILECAAVPVPDGLDGRSLLRLALGQTAAFRDRAISEYYSHSIPGPMRMLRSGLWKYCWYADARPSLFNLRDDPLELHDLAGDGHLARSVAAELDRQLRADWDERLARANFRYAPNQKASAAHVVSRSPNQFVDPDGTIRDAEDFYQGVVWDPSVATQP
jgi:choline-sulfatase